MSGEAVVVVRELAAKALPVLLDAAVKGALLLVLAWAAMGACRRASAATRHLVWLLALAGLVALPVMSAVLPAWRVLPGWAGVAVAPPAPGAPPAPAVEPLRSAPAVDAEPLPGDDRPPVAIEARTPAANVIPAASPTASPAVEPPAPPRPIRLGDLLIPVGVAVWAAGTLICLMPLLLGRVSLWWLTRRSARVGGGRWIEMTRRAAEAVGLRRRVILLASDLRAMPMVWGSLRPVLLLPVEAAGWPQERLRVVLLHELAHARRLDCLTQAVGHLACAVYWFNPLVWAAFRSLQREAERACDDLVLAAGSEPADYAEHVLSLASGLEVGTFAAHAGIAMARPHRRLEQRIRAILDARRNRRGLTRVGMLLAALLVAGFVLPLSILKATAADEPPAGATQPATQPTLDFYAGRLPPGALARLGTTQYRKSGDGFMGRLQFNADASVVRAGLWAWDVRTGHLQAPLPLPREDQYVRVLAFSRDGQLALHTARSGARYLTADTNGLVLTLREAQTGKVARQLEGGAGRGSPVGATFSPDGRYVAVIDGSVSGWDWYGFAVWEVGTGKKIVAGTPVAGNHAQVGGVDFAPDGTLLVLAEGDGVLRLYDLPGGKLARTCQTTAQQLQAPCFIDQQTVCAGARDGLYVWKIDHPAPVHWKANAQVVRQIVVSPDGRFLAAASWKGLLVFELATGKPLLAPDETPSANDVRSLVFSGDGRVLALSRNQCVEFLEVGTWKPMYHPQAHSVTIHALAISDDARVIATGDEHGMIRLWDGRGKPLQTLQHAGRQVLQLALAPDAQTLASPIGLWDIRSGKVRVAYDTDSSCLLSFVDRGREVLEVGRYAITWRDAASGQVTKTIKPDQFCVFVRASLSADGRTLIWSETDERRGKDGRAPGEPRAYTGHVYDMRAGKEVARFPVGPYALALSPDGQRVAVGEETDYKRAAPPDPGVTIRNALTGDVQHRISFERGFPSLLEWSPDGQLLAAEYRDDIIRVYSTRDFSQVGQFTGHADYIQRMRWFADGRKLVTVSFDTTGLIWDTGTLKAIPAPESAPATAPDKQPAAPRQPGATSPGATQPARTGAASEGPSTHPAAPVAPGTRQEARPGDQTDALKLARSIPVITDEDDRIRSLFVSATMRLPQMPALNVQLAYRKPDQCALRWLDPRDGLPLMIVARGQMLVCDALARAVVVAPAGRASLRLSMSGEMLDLKAGSLSRKPDGRPAILLDVPSLLTAEGNTLDLRRESDARVVLTCISARGNLARAVLDEARPWKLAAFEMRAKGEEKPQLSLDRIEVNAPVSDDFLALPDLDRLAARVKVNRLDPKGAEQAMDAAQAMNLAMHSIAARLAAGSPDERRKFEEGLGRAVDWDALREFDAKALGAFREAMPATRPVPGRPATLPTTLPSADGILERAVLADRSGSSWRAKLPAGPKVELVAVAGNPPASLQWWRPDGTLMAQAPDHFPPPMFAGVKVVRPMNAVAVMVSDYQGVIAQEEMDAALTITAHGSTAFLDANFALQAGSPGGVAHILFGAPSAVFFPEASSVTLDVGLPVGPWKTMWEHTHPDKESRHEIVGRPGSEAASAAPYEKEINFGKLLKEKCVFLTFSHNLPPGSQVRVTAVLADGKEMRGLTEADRVAAKEPLSPGMTGFPCYSNGHVGQVTGGFRGVSIKDIKAFRLQTRPYQWAAFENVALRPGAAPATRAAAGNPPTQPAGDVSGPRRADRTRGGE